MFNYRKHGTNEPTVTTRTDPVFWRWQAYGLIWPIMAYYIR